MRAVALLSGGLDSTLAIRVLQEQGVEVTALNFMSVFCTCTPKGSSCSAARTAVQQLGVDLKVINSTEDFLEVVKNPEHGYGSEVNPCIDCRILMFKKARRYMEDIGAEFLVTGEVLGERPMSQRRDAMLHIAREAGVEGLVVRPLCAAHLEPSIPEREGWVDRDRLLDIHGRSRKRQIELAAHYGLEDYPCPAGGCRLTDPGFAVRMRDLMEHDPGFGVNDVQLLKLARHFRLTPEVKAVVGRNEGENERLGLLTREDDRMLELTGYPGPLTIVRGAPDEETLRLAAAITARYTRARNEPEVGVAVSRNGGAEQRELRVAPADDETVCALRIDLDDTA